MSWEQDQILRIWGGCLTCLNKDRKNQIDWKERQQWFTDYLKERSNPDVKWDVVVGVSGGKDSCTIVKRLIEEYKVPSERVLLVHVNDEFTPSEAGMHNLNNLVKKFNVDMFTYRMTSGEFVKRAKEDFLTDLNPLKWIESEIYKKPLEIAKAKETEQESFWKGSFAESYIERKSGNDMLAAKLTAFSYFLRHANGVKTTLEFGENIGMNEKAMAM